MRVPLRLVARSAAFLTAVAATPVGSPPARPMAVPVAAVSATPAAPTTPTVTLDRAEVTPGGRLPVRLAGWPAGTVVVEVCGGEPVGCAVDSSVQTHLTGTGVAAVTLPVAVPPGGCPCQVGVTTLDRRLTATAPLALTGQPRAGAAPVTAHQATVPPVVTAVAVVADRSWWSRLGGPTRHTLVVRLRNDSPAPADVTMSVTVGRGDEPSGFVTPPDVGRLAPGEEREVRVPVRLPTLAYGSWTIAGRVVTAGVGTPFRLAVESRPWGPTALLGLVVVLLTVRVLRSRPERRPAHRAGWRAGRRRTGTTAAATSRRAPGS